MFREAWSEVVKMEKNTIIAVALGILVLISVVQAIQISSLKGQVVGSVVKEDSGGETYEKMMARMHPDQYQASAKSSSPSSSGPTMVGGC